MPSESLSVTMAVVLPPLPCELPRAVPVAVVPGVTVLTLVGLATE